MQNEKEEEEVRLQTTFGNNSFLVFSVLRRRCGVRERRKRQPENQDEAGWLVGHFTNFLLPPSLEVDGSPPAELYARRKRKKTLPHFLVFRHRRRLRLSRKRRRSNEPTNEASSSPPQQTKVGDAKEYRVG